MKRYMILIIIGILLACYGMANVLVQRELALGFEIAKIIGIFVIGFLCIVIGLIYLNKRTLEVLVESTDDRMDDKSNVNVKSLIFDKTVYNKGPNIVVIGGGIGINTVLAGLKKYTDNLTAIVTVSDYGEEKPNYRKELNLLPTGDIKQSMIALANNDEEMYSLMNHSFKNGKLAGISFSDIYFSAMRGISGDFSEAIVRSNEVLNIIGKVLPVTLDEMNIEAELDNGYVVKDKSKIAEVTYDKVTKINRIFVTPSNLKPAPGVLEAIQEADSIIIGPGSLYTNVIPNLLINGVAKAIKESKAIKVYISNIMTEPGQTDEYTVDDHIKAITEHCGKGLIDYCFYDTGEIIPEIIKKYNMNGQDLVEHRIENTPGIRFVQKHLATVYDGFIRHDPNLIASSIIELVCDDMRFQDKQNDPQYMMLSTKLKHDKAIAKQVKKRIKEEKKEVRKAKHEERRKSKFSNKYKERIDSIKEADSKFKTRERRKPNTSNKRDATIERIERAKADKTAVKSEQQLEEIRAKFENAKANYQQKADVEKIAKEKIKTERVARIREELPKRERPKEEEAKASPRGSRFAKGKEVKNSKNRGRRLKE